MDNISDRTSITDPLFVNFIDQEVLTLPGRLGMTLCPGCKHPGHWNRELKLDLKRLKEFYKADVLATLMEKKEFTFYGVPDLLDCVSKMEMTSVHFPIADSSIPRGNQADEYLTFLKGIINYLENGKTVIIHCRGGLGRTGTVSASILAALGYEPNEAIKLVRKFRSENCLQTVEQEQYVKDFYAKLKQQGGLKTVSLTSPPPAKTDSDYGPTSIAHPLDVNFVPQDVLKLPGRLGMTLLPGCKQRGRWNRDLKLDLGRLKENFKTDVLVTLMETKEFTWYKVPNFFEQVAEIGIESIHFPIMDTSIPRDNQAKEYVSLIKDIISLLTNGKTVVIHCRGGLGRTGTVAASVLVGLGYEANESIKMIRSFRSERCLEFVEQEDYVRNLHL